MSAQTRGEAPAPATRRRRLPLRVGLPTLVLLAAVVGTVLSLNARAVHYDATAELIVSPLSRDDSSSLGLPVIRDTGDPIRTIETAATVLRNREIATATAARMGGDWTGDLVYRAIDVTPVGQTNVVEVKATASTAATAAKLANVYASTAVSVRGGKVTDAARKAIAAIQKETTTSATERAAVDSRVSQLRFYATAGDPTIAVAQTAAVPTAPVGTPAWLVLALALFAATVIAVGSVYLIERIGPAASAYDAGGSAMLRRRAG